MSPGSICSGVAERAKVAPECAVVRVWCAVLVGAASCAVRAPAPVNIDALLATRGPIDARRELQIRVIGEPRDVAARLALAELDERIGRPGEAIEALEAVVALGGPLAVRWHAEDRARLGRLIAARGRARLERGAASALADLERARGLGAAITDDELRAARIAGAIVALHHSDADVRDGGRRTLALAASGPASGPGSGSGSASAPASAPAPAPAPASASASASAPAPPHTSGAGGTGVAAIGA
jgi:hypothetical protein